MEFVHHVTIRTDEPGALEDLQRLRVAVKSSDILVAFDITESDANWPEVEGWLASKRAGGYFWTSFSNEEIDAASWLSLGVNFRHQYPQPEDTWIEGTYEDTCQECFGGMRKQVRPFILSKEPSWGRNGIFKMFWVEDEFFVKPDVWKAVFEPIGVGMRPVKNRKGADLTGVVQLDFDDVNTERVHVARDGLVSELCSVCKVTKYSPIVRGYFPELEALPKGDAARVCEHFGFPRTAIAARPVLVSQRVRQELIKFNVRGVTFKPVTGTGVPLR